MKKVAAAVHPCRANTPALDRRCPSLNTEQEGGGVAAVWTQVLRREPGDRLLSVLRAETQTLL